MNMRRLVRSSAAAAIIAIAALASTTAAAADEPGRWFESELFHFGYPADVTIHTTQVSSPEGPVDLITIRPMDIVSGEPVGTSFITLTVYHGGVDTASYPGDTPADVAVAMTLDYLETAFERPLADDATMFRLGTSTVEGRRFVLSDGDAEAQVSVGALLAEGDAVVVFYYQRDRDDVAYYNSLNDIAATFGFGEAPISAPPIGTTTHD